MKPVIQFLTMLPHSAHETLRIFHINRGDALVGITEHSNGKAGRVDFPVRRIVADALAFDAVTIVLSHNHPGGDPQPSRADIVATNYLVRTVAAIGIRVHDHVVTGDGRSFSFRAAGLL
jgi:DNA repair protein RadC